MGASVRVEDAVFGDPRFERLGLLCGLSLADAEAWSIGVMAKIWRQCTSKMSYSLSPSSLNAIARKADFSARLVEAELGDVVPRDDGAIRIRGTAAAPPPEVWLDLAIWPAGPMGHCVGRR